MQSIRGTTAFHRINTDVVEAEMFQRNALNFEK
jgi:hypothetical protein